MNPKNLPQKCGIYCIKNIVNNKMYIGKSKNIYSRMYQHLSDLNLGKRKSKNSHLLNAWEKYGKDNFECFVIELLELNDDLVKNKELYWIQYYDTINRKKGYNLRMDSDTKMIVHKETSKKISERLKKEWSEGIRSNHSKKLSLNWKKTPNRNIIQSQIMTKNLTKYIYYIYDLNNNFIEKCYYKRLKELNLQGITSVYHRSKNKNIKLKHHNHYIEIIKI